MVSIKNHSIPMWFSYAMVQVFSSLLQKSSVAVLHETFNLFCGEKGSPIQSSWYCFTLVLRVAITSASGNWQFSTGMSRNFRQLGENTEVKPASPSAEPEQTPLILSSLFLLTKCTA